MIRDEMFGRAVVEYLKNYLGMGEPTETTIICGFPGVGKSSIEGISIKDLDSKNYIGINRWSNYKEAIEKFVGRIEYLLLSSHKQTRDILKQLNLKYYVVYPDKSLKSEYMRRYKQRGSTREFIKWMDSYFYELIDSIESETDPNCIKIKLSSANQFLKDVI